MHLPFDWAQGTLSIAEWVKAEESHLFPELKFFARLEKPFFGLRMTPLAKDVIII